MHTDTITVGNNELFAFIFLETIKKEVRHFSFSFLIIFLQCISANTHKTAKPLFGTHFNGDRGVGVA